MVFLGLEGAKESWQQETLSPSQNSLCSYQDMASPGMRKQCVFYADKLGPLCGHPVQGDGRALNHTSQAHKALQENTSQ